MRTVDERTASVGEAIRAAAHKSSVGIRVAMPGIIESFNRGQQTVTVRPAIREVLRDGGAETEIEIPLLVDVPIVLPRAGGYLLAFVPEAGDECLVVFADTCIDGWWQSGGVQSQAERRRHDLSDGFAIPGPWSQPNLPELPEKGVRLQDKDGEIYIAIEDKKVEIKSEQILHDADQIDLKAVQITLEAARIDLNGSLYINGSVYQSHTHSVSTGASRTGGVSG